MRKFKNWVMGGIQQKVFNLVLYAILLVVAAYTAVIVWQAHQLGNLSNQTNAQQKEAISNMVNRTMDEQLAKSLGETTQMEANIADDMFADLTSAVAMMADYTGKLYANPSAYPTKDVLPPDASTDGQTTVQLLTEAGVNTKDPAIAQQICG